MVHGAARAALVLGLTVFVAFHVERIYELALSNGRKIDPQTGKAPAVGNTVDLKSATFKNTIGATQLSAVWQDPQFDPRVPAAYYLRLLEIPTPRWTTMSATNCCGWCSPPATRVCRARPARLWRCG